MDSFVISTDIGYGSSSTVILEFIRTAASSGTWSQIQVPKNSALVTMGMWSLGPVNPGAAEFLGRTLTRLGGDQSVDKQIWLYSTSSGGDEHVATIEGFTSFPPPAGQQGGGRISLLNSLDNVRGVGSCTGISCHWQDVSNRGFFKESNWFFDTSAGQSGGGFMVGGSSGSLWFKNPVLNTECELFYCAIGIAIGINLPAGKVPAFIQPLLDRIRPLLAQANALTKSGVGKSVANVVDRAKPSQGGAAVSRISSWSRGLPIFYGPTAAPGELNADALEGPCFTIDVAGSAVLASGSATAFFFNAYSPFGLLSPPSIWSAAALTCGASRGLQFPGAAVTFSKGQVKRGYRKPQA